MSLDENSLKAIAKAITDEVNENLNATMQSNMDQFKNSIQNENKEHVNSLNSVIKTEMKDVLNTVLNKQDEFEKKAETRFIGLEEKIKTLQVETDIKFNQQLSALEKKLDDSIKKRNTSSSISGTGGEDTSRIHSSNIDLSNLIDIAERTVGFHPISESDLSEICRERDISDIQMAMKLLVLDFLGSEMKIKEIKHENKLGLSWAKLSLGWGLMLEIEVEV